MLFWLFWKDGISVKVRRFRRKIPWLFFCIAVQRDESHYVVGHVSNGPKPESLQPQASKPDIWDKKINHKHPKMQWVLWGFFEIHVWVIPVSETSSSPPFFYFPLGPDAMTPPRAVKVWDFFDFKGILGEGETDGLTPKTGWWWWTVQKAQVVCVIFAVPFLNLGST